MARFNLEIAATNVELKKAIAESNKLVNQFKKNAESIKVNIGGGNKRSVDNLNKSLKATDDYLKSIASSANKARASLRGITGTVANVSNIQKEREETARLRREQQELKNEASKLAAETARLRSEQQAYRTEASRSAAEVAKLRLAQQQNRVQTVAAAGSYREAQQRLTALGTAIRNAAGGFSNATPQLRAQVAEYRRLQDQLRAYDRQMGLNYRNVGNYNGAFSTLGAGIKNLAGSYLSLFAAVQGIGTVIKANAAISDTLADVQRTAELSTEGARALFEQLKALNTRTSLNELAQIAVIGGQIGIAQKELVGFTKAVDILSVVLANEIPGGAEAITEALGKINGVFRVASTEGLTAGQAMQKTGSAILALGQAGLATGTFLVDFTQRVAGAARTVGVALPTVLAYGAVLEEAGVSAEVAGTAVSKLIGQLAAKRADFFAIAQIADAELTIESFTDLINTDADAALRKFFAGLAAGGKTTTQFYDILNNAGIKTERYRNAVLLLSQDQEKLTELTKLSNDEYEKGTKAAEQFEIRNNTLGASVAKLWKAFSAGTTSGVISDFFQGIIDGVTESVKAISGLINSLGNLTELMARLRGFIQPGGNTAISNIIGGAVARNRAASAAAGGGGAAQESKRTLAELREALKVQEQIVEIRSNTYQDNKSRKNLEELNYAAEVLAKMRMEHELARMAAEKQDDALKGTVKTVQELSKAQIKAIEKEEKERERAQDKIRKLREENTLDSLKGLDKEIQRIKYRYEEEIRQAKGASDIIKALQVQQVAAIGNAVKASGLLTPGLTGVNQSITTPTTLERTQVPGADGYKPPKVDWSEFTKGMKRATTNFVRDFTTGLDQIAQEADYKLGNIFVTMAQKLSTSMLPVFQNFFANKLEGLLDKSFTNLSTKFGEGTSKAIQGVAAGVGMLGSVVSQITGGKSVAGKAIGGALSGAASGLAIGASIGSGFPIIGTAIGAVVGALGGLLGAGRQRKIEEEQLAEQRKQTALMERQNALAYTSQIIGQMTNNGIVSGVSRNEFGDVVFRIQGRELVATLAKEEAANRRGL